MSKVLSLVVRAISCYLVKKAGYRLKTACTGAVTLIPRFGSALNLNVHFHMLFLDGVYPIGEGGCIGRFKPLSAPTPEDMSGLLYKISKRISQFLERQGLLAREMRQSYLTLD